MALIKLLSQTMNRPIIAEGLNNVYDEVEQFYKINCPTFYKKITANRRTVT